MHLYHQPRSRSTRVLWLIEEIGAPAEVTVMAREYKHTAAYKALHPLGRSPVLVEAGGPIFESAAICLHVAERYPEAGLIARSGTHERALQYQWCFFAMTELESPLIDGARELWNESAPPDEARLEAARHRFWTAAAALEGALDGRDHLVGDGFSVADVVIGGVLSFSRMAEIADIPPGLVGYLDGLEARPARQRAYTRTE
jgi:glutathione S-transferase